MRHPRSTTFPTTLALATLIVAALAGCSDRSVPTSPLRPTTGAADKSAPSSVAQLVRQLAAGRGIIPLPRRPTIRPALVRLGQALAFDKILSGPRNISCMTCHLPQFATGDARSLSIGQGGTGLGPNRIPPNGVFIPRNAPPLFNLNAMAHLFWDGRVAQDASGFHTPAGDKITPAMTRVFDFGALSAQPMFPVTNRFEMRGFSDNELAAIPDNDLPRIWAGIMRRLGAIPEYRIMFELAYPGTRFQDMTFAHAANAIAAFFIDQFTFDDTPWDRFLAGNDYALSERQLAGAQTFLTLKCSICHTGATFSDEQFHDVAVAQIGPGEGNGANGLDDFGRMNVTGLASDQYRFRTTPLRNVELSGPYGHDGSITTLRGFVAHYSQSDQKLLAFDVNQLEPALRGTLLNNQTAILARRDTLLNGVVFGDDIINQLMDYMSALTDPAARNLSRSVPFRVPSGLPIDRP